MRGQKGELGFWLMEAEFTEKNSDVTDGFEENQQRGTEK